MNKLYIYPSLLDAFTNYLNAEEVYMKYWGNSENPSKTLEEFLEQEKQSLIDRINRVPTEPIEAADKGTMLNEIVDCIILGRKPHIGEVEKVTDVNDTVVALKARLHNFEFVYPISLVNTFVSFYRNALPQVLVSADLRITKGVVNLYGFIDYLNPLSVHDMKTTNSYNPFKFKNHWQHIVYMYCLRQQGNDTERFLYDICEWTKEGYEMHFEQYTWNDSYLVDLRGICDSFWNFVEENRELITNNSIFEEREHKH